MQWIKVTSSVVDHPKMGDLMEAGGLDELQANGLVLRLWCWCSTYAESGYVSRDRRAFVARRIARPSRVHATEPCADAENALLWLEKSGWIESDKDGGFWVHDWDEHQAAHRDKANKDAERLREKRKASRGHVARHKRDGSATVRASVAGREEKRREEKKRDPREQVAPPETDPRHAPLVEALVAAFRSTRGSKYGFNKRDARAVSELLALGEPPEVQRRWSSALKHTGFPAVSTLHELVKHWNHFATEPANKNGSSASAGSWESKHKSVFLGSTNEKP